MDASQFSFFGGVLLGLASALHCAGMCGGIATGLTMMFAPDELRARARVLALAQTGRITAYVLVGAAVGFAGSGLYQLLDMKAAYQILQWAAAAALMWVGLTLAGLLPMPMVLEAGVGRVYQALVRLVEPWRTHTLAPFLSGLCWGLLPCPMVYAALFTAMLTGSAAGGATIMAGFGLATMPSVFATALGVTSLARINASGWARVGLGLAIAAFGFSTAYPGSPTAAIFCAPPA